MGACAYLVYAGIGRIVDVNRYLFSAAACVASIAVAVIVYVVMVVVLRLFTREELALIPGGRKLMRFAK